MCFFKLLYFVRFSYNCRKSETKAINDDHTRLGTANTGDSCNEPVRSRSKKRVRQFPSSGKKEARLF